MRAGRGGCASTATAHAASTTPVTSGAAWAPGIRATGTTGRPAAWAASTTACAPGSGSGTGRGSARSSDAAAKAGWNGFDGDEAWVHRRRKAMAVTSVINVRAAPGARPWEAVRGREGPVGDATIHLSADVDPS